jgi:hypothetical protein
LVSAGFTMCATHQGKSTREKVTIAGISTWRFAEDDKDKEVDYKIKECWFYWDPRGLMKKRGDVPETQGQSSSKP